MSTDRKAKIISFLEKDPDSSFLLFALAKEYEADLNTTLAIHTYERLLSIHPTYTGAYYHLGKQYELLSDPEKAIGIYQLGISICNQQKAIHDASELRGALENLTFE